MNYAFNTQHICRKKVSRPFQKHPVIILPWKTAFVLEPDSWAKHKIVSYRVDENSALQMTKSPVQIIELVLQRW